MYYTKTTIYCGFSVKYQFDNSPGTDPSGYTQLLVKGDSKMKFQPPQKISITAITTQLSTYILQDTLVSDQGQETAERG